MWRCPTRGHFLTRSAKVYTQVLPRISPESTARHSVPHRYAKDCSTLARLDTLTMAVRFASSPWRDFVLKPPGPPQLQMDYPYDAAVELTPCGTCGSLRFWYDASGWRCAGCFPRVPKGAVMTTLHPDGIWEFFSISTDLQQTEPFKIGRAAERHRRHAGALRPVATRAHNRSC
jgi:hypothetical protein